MSLRHLIKDLGELGVYDDICISLNSDFQESYGYYYTKKIIDERPVHYMEKYYISKHGKSCTCYRDVSYRRGSGKPYLIRMDNDGWGPVRYLASFIFNKMKFYCRLGSELEIQFETKLSHTNATEVYIRDIRVKDIDDFISICQYHIRDILKRHYASLYKRVYTNKTHERMCKLKCGDVCKYIEDKEFLERMVQ